LVITKLITLNIFVAKTRGLTIDFCVFSYLQRYTFPGTDFTIEEGRSVKIYNLDISRKIHFFV
jgi:hypothetical protein